MFKSFLLAGLAATFLSVAGAAPAEATVLDFTLTVSNGDSETWTQTDMPVPIEYSSAGPYIVVANASGSFGSPTYVVFDSSSNNGGVDVTLPDYYKGPQIFSGSTSAPIFAPGVFDLTGGTRANSSQTAVLTITAAAVPEAATWAMMLLGLGVVGAVARRRQNVRIAYA
jgi:hypothetical protein